jgi:hypothetical protein
MLRIVHRFFPGLVITAAIFAGYALLIVLQRVR